MFAAIARFDVRFRWLIVVVWIAGVIAAGRLLPGLSIVLTLGHACPVSANLHQVAVGGLQASISRIRTNLRLPSSGRSMQSRCNNGTAWTE